MGRDFHSIIERIKQVKSLRFDSQIADLLGFSQKALTARKRTNSIPVDKLKVFCTQESINYHWLATGEGEPLIRPGWDVQENDQSIELERVDLFDVRLGFEPKSSLQFSGGGTEPYMVIQKEIWKNFHGPIRAFRVEGVEYSPFAENEDIIIVACGEREVHKEHLYAIRTHQSLSVRQVYLDHPYLMLAPIKLGDAIESIDLNKSPDPLVGRVIGVIKSH